MKLPMKLSILWSPAYLCARAPQNIIGNFRNIGTSNKNSTIHTLRQRTHHTKAYITTPIYYVNAVPHIGHLYSSVLADTLKRYYQLKGAETFLCTGTDEHGLKIQQAAEKHNKKPIEFCNEVSESFKALCKAANVDYTTFIRTTEKKHTEAVEVLWNTLVENGYIYKGEHEGWYAVSDEAFYASNQVHEVVDEKTGQKNMVAIESGQRVEWTSEENYKFKLSAFQDKLLSWITENPTAIVPINRKNEVLSWIRSGLSDLSVSRVRSRLEWGIQVPKDPGHTVYVWLDALTNYMTASGYPWKSEEEKKNSEWPANVHVVGKDIVRFHAIYWPAFLMAANLPLPRQILAHAHWTIDKQKMSKSRGNVADPFELLKTYGVDPVRFYLMRDGGLADDGDYSEDMLKTRYKKDLAGQLGNLLSRSTGKSLMPSSTIPGLLSTVHTRDAEIHEHLEQLSDTFVKAFDEREFSKGFDAIFDVLSHVNKYFTVNQPWTLKGEADKAQLDAVLFYTTEACRISGTLLQPVMPTKMRTLLDRLGVSLDQRTFIHAKLGAMGEQQRALGNDTGVLFNKL
ncbi:tRNA synthetases class I (M)-domain-containing protein [Spinellus fusiger]|nr:tRNA synthetases class I (M)-domain-containing protein [Spinellus fusiger]